MSTLFLPGIAQIKPRGFSSSVIHFFSTRDDLKRPAKTLNSLYQGAKQKVKFDGFVKSPSAALRFTFVVAAYLVSTPHSSGLARLAYGAFYFAIPIFTFCETIKFPYRNLLGLWEIVWTLAGFWGWPGEG